MAENGDQKRSLQVDTLAAELAGLAVLHREEWTPGCAIEAEGRVPAAARVCSVAAELAMAASHVIELTRQLERVDHVSGEPAGEAWTRTSLAFARVAAAAVCAYCELEATAIAEHPNRLRRRLHLVGELDELCWSISETGFEPPGGPTPGPDAELGEWLPAATARMHDAAGGAAHHAGLDPLGAVDVTAIVTPRGEGRPDAYDDICPALFETAAVCALAAEWFQRRA